MKKNFIEYRKDMIIHKGDRVLCNPYTTHDFIIAEIYELLPGGMYRAYDCESSLEGIYITKEMIKKIEVE